MTELEFLQLLQRVGITGKVAQVLKEAFVAQDHDNEISIDSSSTMVELFH